MTLAEQAKDTFPSGLHATVRPIFDDFARGTDRSATLARLGALIDLPDVLIADYTANTPPDQPLAFYTIVLPGGSTIGLQRQGDGLWRLVETEGPLSGNGR